jgi:hypothetical protein
MSSRQAARTPGFVPQHGRLRNRAPAWIPRKIARADGAVAGVADANGPTARLRPTTDVYDRAHDIYASSVAAIARSEADFGMLRTLPEWQPLRPDPRQWVWTDDYSNIIGAIIRHHRE